MLAPAALALLTLIGDPSVRAQTLYLGPHQTIDDPACIMAAHADGALYLVLPRTRELKRIEGNGRLRLEFIGPALGADAAVVSGDDAYVAAHDGLGVGFVAPRSRYPGLDTYGEDRWRIASAERLDLWRDSDEADSSSTVSALAGRDGVMWAVGYHTDHTRGHAEWLVRQRQHAGAWRTIDRQPGSATAVHVAPDGTVFVAGVQDHRWIVRRSAGGQPFETVDTFSFHDGEDTVPQAIAADGRGRVYVVGFGSLGLPLEEADDNDAAHWLVRASADGGRTFHPSDDFAPGRRGEARADAVVVLPSGDVVVVGGARVPRRRVVRLLPRGRHAWKTVDERHLPTYEHRFGLAAVGGALYVVGTIHAGGQQRCLIERLTLR